MNATERLPKKQPKQKKQKEVTQTQGEAGPWGEPQANGHNDICWVALLVTCD